MWCGAAGTWNGADLQLISLISLCNFPPRQASNQFQQSSQNQPINKHPALGFQGGLVTLSTQPNSSCTLESLISESRNQNYLLNVTPSHAFEKTAFLRRFCQTNAYSHVCDNIVIRRAQHPRRQKTSATMFNQQRRKNPLIAVSRLQILPNSSNIPHQP